MSTLGQQLSTEERSRLVRTYMDGYREVIRTGPRLLNRVGPKWDRARALRHDLWNRLVQGEPLIDQAIQSAKRSGQWSLEWPQSALEIRQRISQEEQQRGLSGWFLPALAIAVLVSGLAIAFWPLASAIAGIIREIRMLITDTWPLAIIVGALLIGHFLLTEHRRGTFKRLRRREPDDEREYYR